MIQTNPNSLNRGSRRRVLLILLGAVFVGGMAFLALRTREPVYQGKPLSLWVWQLEMGDYSAQIDREQAIRALRAMGGGAVPCLIRALETSDSRLTEAVNQYVRSEAAGLLLKIDPEAAAKAGVK